MSQRSSGYARRPNEDYPCSAQFTERNFAPSTYIDPTGRSLPCYCGPEHGWLISAKANQRLAVDGKFKEEARPVFQTYQRYRRELAGRKFSQTERQAQKRQAEQLWLLPWSERFKPK